jgi:hypothetical protein
MRRLNGSVLVLVVCALVAGGCGSSSSSSSAQSKCLDSAKKISDANARSVAEQACKSASTASTQITNAVSTAAKSATSAAQTSTNAISTAVQSTKSAAKQACLTAAQNIPAGSAHDQAVASCNKIK